MLEWIEIGVYLVCFAASFYALTCVKFENFCKVQEPVKVNFLLLLLAIGLGYVVAQFVLMLTIYH